MKRSFYTFIFFRLMGWKIEGTFDENVKKCVLMVLPHTSWHDFYIGIFVRGICDVEINFIAKKELFLFPFGFYFRWMGGEPIDRTGSLNKVDAIVNVFEKHNEFRFAIAPEGTRKKVNKLRSGFYYIAVKANVPIIPVSFDFKRKTVSIGKPFYPTANYEEDLKIVLKHFECVFGKNPEKGFNTEK